MSKRNNCQQQVTNYKKNKCDSYLFSWLGLSLSEVKFQRYVMYLQFSYEVCCANRS